MYKLILKYTLIGFITYLLFTIGGYFMFYLLLLLLFFFEGFLLMKVLNDKRDDTKESKEKGGFATIIFIALIIFFCYFFALDNSYQKFWYNISYLLSFIVGIIIHSFSDTKKDEQNIE